MKVKSVASWRRATFVTLAALGILLLNIVGMSLVGERLVVTEGRLVIDPVSFFLYHLSDFAFVIGAVLLMFSAMLWSNAGFIWASRSAMIASGLFLGLVLTDQYILHFRYDTSGPGGYLVTHANWARAFLRFNSYEVWEREISDEDKAPLTIAVVGNSFTAGQGVRGAQYRFSAVSQTLLRDHGTKATVLNFAGIRSIETLSKVQPDVVLLCYSLMDIVPIDFVNTAKFSVLNSWQKFSVFSPTLNFFIWMFAGSEKYQLYGFGFFVNHILAYSDDKSFSQYMNGIEKMAEQVRAIGARPVYVLLPFPHLWFPFARSVREKVHNTVEHGLADAGIPLIDLTPIEDEVSMKEFEVSPMDAHPNERMHDLMAHRLYDGLVPLLTKWHLPKQSTASGGN